MNKQYFTDANGIEWTIEEVKNDKRGFCDEYIWIHVSGENEQYSGFVGQTIEDAFGEFMQGGYLEDETKNNEPTKILYRDEDGELES